MSLQVWLPLNGSTINQGIAGFQPAAAGITYANSGKIGTKSCSSGSLLMSAEKTATILNNQAITIAFWIKPLANSAAQIFGNDNGMGANNNRKFALWQYPTGQDFHWSWMNDAASTTFTTGSVTGAFPLNTWTHLCITYNNPNVTIYVNGEQRATSSGISNSSTFAYDTTILHSNSNRNINDFRIYDHCLSPREVKLLAQGLVAHYKLDGLKLTNLMPSTQNYYGEGVTSATVDTAIKKYNASIKVIGGSGGECYIRPNVTINYISGHKYYARADIYQTQKHGSSDFYIILAEPCWYSGKSISNVNSWTRISNILSQTKWDNQSTRVRLDYNNGGNTTIPMWFDGIMLIDLTEAFGAGNEPSVSWCDANIPYFIGTYEKSSAADCSGYSNHLLQTGSIININASPRYSTAVNFNQTGYFKIDNFNLTAPQFTCAFWVKAPSTTTDQHFLFGTHNNWTNNGLSAWRDKNGSSYSVIIRSDAETSHSGFGFSFNANTWEHIVYTYTGTEVIGYRNGIEFNRSTYGKNGNVVLPVIYLGNSLYNNAPASETDEASVSDFRIYATALSAAAVKELYQSSISFLDNGTLQCSEIVELPTNLKFKENGITQAELISEIGYTNKMKIKTLSDGSAWARIHWLDVSSNPKNSNLYFTGGADEVTYCVNQSNRFSLMCYVDKFKTINNNYEFMLTYPKELSGYNRWAQTSSANSSSVSGLVKITTAWDSHNYGIRKNGSSSMYNCDTGGTWYASIGQYGIWDSANNLYIPNANGTNSTEVELWVRIDNLPKLTKLSMLNGALQAHQIYEL